MKRFRIPLGLRLALALGIALFGVAAMLVTAHLSTLNRLQQVRSDYRRLHYAIGSLGLDNCGLYYPEDTHLRRASDPILPLTLERIPRSRQQYVPFELFICLTTPVAYLSQLPEDPFNPGHDYGYATFRYGKSRGGVNFMAILSSPGPDGRVDLPLEKLRPQIADYLDTLFPRNSGPFFTPTERMTMRQWIDPYLYDPTNGTRSQGDLILLEERHQLTYGFGWTERPSPEWANAQLGVDAAREAGKGRIPSELQAASEATATNDMVDIPEELWIILGEADVFDAYAQGTPIIKERINNLYNHLGPFQAFFAHPSSTGLIPQLPALNDWRREDFRWWGSMNKLYTSPRKLARARQGGCLLNASNFYPVLIMYGKSQILLAASEAAQNKKDVALERIDNLRHLLKHNNIMGSLSLIQRYVSIARIHQELGRLCDELEQNIRAGK